MMVEVRKKDRQLPLASGALDPSVTCSPSRYNRIVVKRTAHRFRLPLVVSTLVLSLAASLSAQQNPPSGRTLVVIPFENTSPTPGLEWLGEAFPVTFRAQLDSPLLYVATREERLRAYDRQGVPSGVHPSRATIYRLAEQMDVDYAVLGSYSYNGARLTATAQLLDMRAQKILPPATESAPLSDFASLQSALAWDLVRLIRPNFAVPKDRYIAAVPPMRLDALENYVRERSPPRPTRKFSAIVKLPG